jgi:fructokinase
VIAVCGEALVDLVSSGHGTYDALPGGSPANCAVALARLGVPSMLLARLSRDSSGRLVRQHLTTNGVDLSRAVDADEPSSLAIVSLADDGTATYRFLMDGTADWQWTDEELPPLPADVVAVHSGSLALARSAALERFLVRSRPGATISIDPNLRAGLVDVVQARADLDRWLRLADLVKASTEDLDLLHPGEDPYEVALRWASAGPGVVVVTCASEGAFAVVAGDRVDRPAVPTTVVDTVAAGDTFSAGFLEHLHRHDLLGGRLDGLAAGDVAGALDRGLRAAAVTCSRVGADPPWAAEL